ncbi:hypothetical protein J4Q44_G00157120 [Coregonus suidteri]|uniref:Uncharacterized protein n=1 Tax=Coregonus suidteri TaxID=861788 RepID=A0AAN8QXH5_9TELE
MTHKAVNQAVREADNRTPRLTPQRDLTPPPQCPGSHSYRAQPDLNCLECHTATNIIVSSPRESRGYFTHRSQPRHSHD